MRLVRVSNLTRVHVWLIPTKWMRMFRWMNQTISRIKLESMHRCIDSALTRRAFRLRSSRIQPFVQCFRKQNTALPTVDSLQRIVWVQMFDTDGARCLSPCIRDEKLRIQDEWIFAFSYRCVYCHLLLLCSVFLLHVDRRRRSLRLLVRDFPFSLVNLIFFLLLNLPY